jgi:hypothetical protein
MGGLIVVVGGGGGGGGWGQLTSQPQPCTLSPFYILGWDLAQWSGTGGQRGGSFS